MLIGSAINSPTVIPNIGAAGVVQEGVAAVLDFTNGENVDLQLRAWVTKTNQKFRVQRSVKKVILTIFWGIKELTTIDLL